MKTPVSLLAGMIVALSISANLGYSQEKDKELDALLDLSLEDLLNVEVTTATKTSGRLDVAPAIVEVITGEQLQERGYSNLGQLLNDITGNHEDRSNWGIGEPLNQNVGFGFRFDTGQNILILFNGQRLNAFLPGNRFGGEEYLLNNIDRIEIIRGPGSAIYGTGAFTQIVNIISKKITDSTSELVQIGSQYIPTSAGYVLTGNMGSLIGEKGSLTGAIRFSQEKGQSLLVKNALFGNQKIKDGIGRSLDAEMVFNNGSLNIYSKFTNQKRNTFTGFNSVSPDTQDELKLSMYAYSIGSDYTFRFTPKASLKLSAGWHQDNWTEVALIPQFKLNNDGSDLQYDDSGLPILDTVSLYRNGTIVNTSFFIDGQGADTRSLDGEAQFTYSYQPESNLVLGLYASDDKVLSAFRPSELNLAPLEFVPFRVINDPANNWLFDADASRRTVAGYFQAEQKISKLIKLTAGARLDHYSGSGALSVQNYNEFNPKSGVVFDAGKNGTFKFLFGTATRIPNGFETLSAVAILGDPQNRPERLRMLQLQWIKNWGNNFRTELGGFKATITNRLVTNADIPGYLKAQGYIGQFINADTPKNPKNHGLEGKLNARIKKNNISANFTHYFRSDDGYGNKLSYIPTTMINAEVTTPFGWFTFSTGLNYRNQFTKAPLDPRAPVKSYLIARLHAVMTPPKSRIKMNFTFRNLLNTKYAYPASSLDFTNHFPARGFEAILGITARLD